MIVSLSYRWVHHSRFPQLQPHACISPSAIVLQIFDEWFEWWCIRKTMNRWILNSAYIKKHRNRQDILNVMMLHNDGSRCCVVGLQNWMNYSFRVRSTDFLLFRHGWDFFVKKKTCASILYIHPEITKLRNYEITKLRNYEITLASKT